MVSLQNNKTFEVPSLFSFNSEMKKNKSLKNEKRRINK